MPNYINMNPDIREVDAVILPGQFISSAGLDISNGGLAGVTTSSDFLDGGISFLKGSTADGEFVPYLDSTSTCVGVPSASKSNYYGMVPDGSRGIKFIKVVSSVVQTNGTTLTLSLMRK